MTSGWHVRLLPILPALVALALVPAPVSGDEPAAFGQRGPSAYYVYAPGTGPGFDDQYVYPQVVARGGTLHDVVVTVDTSATAGAIEWSDEGGGCRLSGAVFTCAIGELQGSYDIGPLKGRAATGSAPGDGGVVTFHATSPDASPLDWTMRATVGRPELTVRRVAAPTGLEPGEAFAIPVTVRNAGNVPAQGFRVEVDAPDDVGLTPLGGPACHWRPAFDHPDASAGQCSFRRVLRPGQAVRLDLPFRATARPTLLYGDLAVTAFPIGGEIDKEVIASDYSIVGPGPRMRLRGAPGVDPEVFEDGVGLLELRVTGRNSADFEAFGDSVRGHVGEVVQVVVGTRNLGPAVLDVTAARQSAYRLVFVPPPGTTVVSNPYPGEDDPWTCSPGHRGADRYVCLPYSERVELRRAEKFVFDLLIDRRESHATGRVRVLPNHRFRSAFDANPGNDSAEVVVHSTGGAASETGGEATPPTRGDSGSGHPPAVPLVAGAGAGAVVLMLGLAVAVRRRARMSTRP